MPLFSRTDAQLVAQLPPIRRAMPFVLRTRHEALIYHTVTFDLTDTLVWLRRYNAAHPGRKTTFFHLYLWACGRNFHEFPYLNRFVSGGRIYERREVSVAFSVKQAPTRAAPAALTKLEMPADEPFESLVGRVTDLAQRARKEPDGLARLELELVDRMPPMVTSSALRVMKWLDQVNLLPQAVIADDPMFASLMVANVGSVGMVGAYHHLCEYGTCSMFAVLGLIEKRPLVVDGDVQIRDVVDVHYTSDERMCDAFYAAQAIDHIQEHCEQPERFVGSVTGG